MEKDELDKNIHLGENIKCLMRAFRLQQNDLAQKTGYSESQLSNILRKADIDDETFERLSKGLENGITPEIIKAYNHEDTVKYIINNYTQNVENGGTGNFKNDHNHSSTSTFNEVSAQNNYVAEQIFDLTKKNTELEKIVLFYRMKNEPETVEKEMESLIKRNKAE